MQTTIIGNSYLVNHTRTRDQVRYVCEALDELKEEVNVLSMYHKHMIIGPRKKIEDVKYEIHPSLAFINQSKKANRRHQEITQKAYASSVLIEKKLADQDTEDLKTRAANYPTIGRGRTPNYPTISRG